MLEWCNIDSQKYTVFEFGMGIEHIVTLCYGLILIR
ncbi:MAG: hypothetical protein ACQETJ_06435 [Bacteroidota bacterium]